MVKTDEATARTAAIVDKPRPIFGKVTFTIPGSRTVSDRYNRVSVLMLGANVPVLGTGLSIKSAIYANLERTADGASVIPSAYLPTKLVGVDVEGADEAFKAHVEDAALAYGGYDDAYSHCARLLLGHVDPSARDQVKLAAVKRPNMTRLIGKDGAIVASAPAKPEGAPATA